MVGQLAQEVRRLATGLNGQGSILGVGGSGDFSSLFRSETGPGEHSASNKMSTGAFPGVKTAELRISHPTSS